MSTKRFSRKSRTFEWKDPRAEVLVWSDMAGIDYLRAMMEGRVAVPPVWALVDFRLTEVEEGRATLQIRPAEFHFNRFSTVQGGIIATALDAAMACAVHSLLPAGAGFSSPELKVNYFRPVSDQRDLRCEATIVHRGRKVTIAEARMVDEEGRLYAHATSTFLITGIALSGDKR